MGAGVLLVAAPATIAVPALTVTGFGGANEILLGMILFNHTPTEFGIRY